MIGIKDRKMPSCCGECEYIPKDCSYCLRLHQAIPRDIFNTSRLSNCPLVEIGTCKECKYYTVYEIEYFQTNQKEQFSYCEKYERLGNNHLSPDFYCGDFKKRGDENE